MEKVTNPLRLSWHDPAWVPHLNKDNVLMYFSERSNPFYDRTCNNETIKMQRLGLEHLENMTGLEYILLHHQEPILYVIRKRRRQSKTQVTTLADYHIIDGTVYQAPDLGSVCNSRLMTTLHHLEAAFTEVSSYSRYHPAKGYSWQFKEKEQQRASAKPKEKKNEEPGSMFQCGRVDMLLSSLTNKFPQRFVQTHTGEKPIAVEEPVSVKTEKQQPAPITVPNPVVPSTVPHSRQSLMNTQDNKGPPEKRIKYL